MRRKIYLIVTALIGLAMLGLSACFDAPAPYYYGHPAQYGERSGRGGGVYCDANGNRCVRCDADRDDCHAARGYSRPWW